MSLEVLCVPFFILFTFHPVKARLVEIYPKYRLQLQSCPTATSSGWNNFYGTKKQNKNV